MNTPLTFSSIDPDLARQHLYEVIVVGAGPAGSSAAYHLAESGVDVLLVERAAFPRTKPCGDAVMPPSVCELQRMSIVDVFYERFRPVTRVDLWMNGMRVSQDPLEENATGYVAPRREFDTMLCAHALRRGANWLNRVTVVDVESHPDSTRVLVYGTRGGSTGPTVELQARLVIAADGSGSRIARKLRAHMEAHHQPLVVNPLTAQGDDRARFTALRGYVRDITTPATALEFYFRGEAGTTYYWIFPVGPGIANVGVIASMAQLRSEKTNLVQALTAFLQAPELEGRAGHARFVGQVEAAPVAAGLRGTALFGERILCIGDAAALVDPGSAEGISAALWSGRTAAETAREALRKGDCSLVSLSAYGSLVNAKYQARYDAMLPDA
jgi:geranylgeranyl reductase family protein